MFEDIAIMLQRTFLTLLVLFAASLIPWSVGFTENYNDKDKICQRTSIFNTFEFDEKLRGCTVIEGSLQISLIWERPNAEVYHNISFPELREITGYLMVFDTVNLLTLRNLFPNLAVIRGQELVESFALVISKMPHMQEVGLPSLTNILRGGVWLVDNANLCYVDTIDWLKIANESKTEGIFKNKQMCPNTCQDNCPESEFDKRKLCWSKKNCQMVPQLSCPSRCNGGPCYVGGCCHSQCLGGCFGPDASQCHVCKGVAWKVPAKNPICTDVCPEGFYEYLQRRCVSATECLNIVAIAPENHPDKPRGNFTGKWYTTKGGKKMCVVQCPKDTELAPNGTACVQCEGQCRKNCPGRTVDSIEVARELSGCTRITGALKIHIRRGSASASGTIVKELRQNLDKIEEIDHYLAITYTYSIYSLDFLENLKLIRGKVLDEDKYALIVKSNDNLMELWNSDTISRKIIIESKKARVLFHYNPKLCEQKIWHFVKDAGINPPADDKIDIGITNGDKVPCNTKQLKIEVRQKTNQTVMIQWENFRRNLTKTSYLLNYEIHYKEAHAYPLHNESKFDDRDPCGDDGWIVQEQAKIRDNEVKGLMEPTWENERLIVNLKSYTWYALYVKAIVIPDTYGLNNNTGAESDIIYFRTLADFPTKPLHFKLAAGGPDKVTISWEPPATVNGIMSKFRIWIKHLPESQSFQDQRDYCKDGRNTPTTTLGKSSTESFATTIRHSTPTLPSPTMDGSSNECCSCAAPTPLKKGQNEDRVFDEDAMFDIIMGRYLFPNPEPPEDENNDPKFNEIRKTRRRRGVTDEGDHASTSEEVSDHNHPEIFPEDTIPSIPTGKDDKLPVPTGMRIYREIQFNSTVPTYTLVLENLTHYTTYDIGVQACRELDPDITENDTRICSEINSQRIQTSLSQTADNIDPRTVSLNVTTSRRLHIAWGEPGHPNGVIMAYVIRVQRIGSSKDELAISKCITHQAFLKSGRNYSFPDLLPAGNYSLQIKVASLAQDSEFSPDRYFYIEDNTEAVPGFWVLVILVPILLIIILTSVIVLYFIKTKGIYGPRVISANPEYMPNVDIPEEWEVPRFKIKVNFNKELGQGSFGTVYQGSLVDFIIGHAEVLCAVKTVAEEVPSEERALFLKEAALMTKLNCDHVVKLLGVVSKTQPIYVIMELMYHGDLKNYLRSRRPDPKNESAVPPPTLKQILRIAAEIADGMSYIHSNRLVHRDLAARNCLVHENLVVKVGDFGMTKEVISDYYRKQTRGLLPVRWMAPESLLDGVFTTQSDVWSFGVVLWEMATLAAQPYQGLQNNQVLDYVQSGRVMEMPENCPDILYELMSRCWQYDARDRPTFIDILERLTPYLDPSFAQVSFYHSPAGFDYRTQASLRPTQEELITIRTSLRATLCEDEFDDYDSDDDQNRLSHHIVDDLDETSKRLISSSPARSQITSATTPKSPLENGITLAISGNNGSYLKNGSYTLQPTVSSSQPSTLFSNPPLRTSLLSSTPNAHTNYTEASFSTPVTNSNSLPSTNYTIPLTPVKVSEVKSKSKLSDDKPSIISSNRSPTTYTSLTPLLSQNSGGQIITNNRSGSGTGVDSNDSSKSYTVNFSGDGYKYCNGGTSGGNGHITLPVTGSQRNKTTQF